MVVQFLKNRWNYFAQAAAIIITIIGTFLVTPPLLSIGSDYRIESFSRFIIASLLAFLYIPLKKKSSKSKYRFWYKMAAVCFVAGLISVGIYTKLLQDWSIKFYNEKVLVIGKNMYPEAEKDKVNLAQELNRRMVDNETFVRARQGNTYDIWPKAELSFRFYLMSMIYILCAVLIGSFIITIIQSIYCYEGKS
jgi:hypothetical protein